ncbi:hypothetical protein ScPMuIL_017142 [Solemya velum]
MELILAILRPKQTSANHDFRLKHYDILLLDHKLAAGERGKPMKYLPALTRKNFESEPRDEILAHVYQITGAEHGGIKGERAICIARNRKERSSFNESRFSLYCVPVNSRDKLNRIVDKSVSSPGFYSLEYVVEALNGNSWSFPFSMRALVTQLEAWLKEKHLIQGSLEALFRSRADFRVHLSVNNPAFLPSFIDSGGGSIATQEQMRLRANEALAKMLAIEKCELVVVNSLFADTSLSLKSSKVGLPSSEAFYVPLSSSFHSTEKSLDVKYPIEELYPLHKLAMEGNVSGMRECIGRGMPVAELDTSGWAPIHWAAWYGHIEAVRTLLEKGCSPNIVNDTRATPLHIAARKGFPDIVRLLLQHADIDCIACDKSGKTALDFCEQEQDRNHKKCLDHIKASISRPSQISVHVLDGTVKKLNLVSGSNTTVDQLNHQMLREFNMAENPYVDIFTIWICSKSLELQLKSEHKPMEQLHDWKRKIVKMLTDGQPSEETPELRWRRNAKLSLSKEREVHHPDAIRLLFHEAYYNYISALYPCKDQDVLFLAAVLMYKYQGEYDAPTTKAYFSNSKNLQRLVPGPMLKAKNSTNWQNRISVEYRNFCALEDRPDSRSEVLMVQFLNCCRNLTVYGSAFFSGSLLGKSSHGVHCHIGVNDVGIHIINSQTKIMLHSYKYSEIHWEKPDATHLEITVVRPENKNSPRTSLKIRSKQSGLIHQLMAKLFSIYGIPNPQS